MELVIFTRSVTLTDAQIKALPTTAIEIIPAPAAGTFIAPLAAWAYLNWAADYTNLVDAENSRVALGYAGTLISVLSPWNESELFNLLADGASHTAFTGLQGTMRDAHIYTQGAGQFQDEPGVLGAALEVYGVNSGGDFTGGDPANTLKITVWYGIVEVT